MLHLIIDLGIPRSGADRGGQRDTNGTGVRQTDIREDRSGLIGQAWQHLIDKVPRHSTRDEFNIKDMLTLTL